MKIRRATADDLPWIRHLFARFQEEHPQGYPGFDAEELDHFTVVAYRHLTQNPRFACWLAIKGKTPVGMFGGELCERMVGKPHVYANALFAWVDAAHRGGDVGFRLTEAFATFAEQQGVEWGEFQAVAGDTQWSDRGIAVVATRYAIPIRQGIDQWRAHVYPLHKGVNNKKADVQPELPLEATA